jgi:carbamate kinase
MIGYLIEQELGNLVPFEKPIATILTMTEVDADDPAMKDPTKFVGPVYAEDEAKRLAVEKGWTVKPDGAHWRRVVPSPLPKRIFEIRPIKQLLASGTIVICTGGGGIPTMYLPGEALTHPSDRNPRTLVGVEAVIDKDRSSAVLAKDLEADLLVIATDADAVFLDWGLPTQRAIATASPDALAAFGFAAGSMGPKVDAVCDFARSAPGKVAAIGALADITEILAGTKGTRVSTDYGPDLTFR